MEKAEFERELSKYPKVREWDAVIRFSAASAASAPAAAGGDAAVQGAADAGAVGITGSTLEERMSSMLRGVYGDGADAAAMERECWAVLKESLAAWNMEDMEAFLEATAASGGSQSASA